MKVKIIVCLLAIPLIAIAEVSESVANETEIIEVGSDKQPLEASFKFKGIYTDMDVANSLGVVNNINGFIFVSQVDNGARLDDWGETYELDFDHLFHFTFDDNDYSIGATFGAEFLGSRIGSDKTLNVGEGLTTVYVDLLPINGDVSPGALFEFANTGVANVRQKIVFRRLYADIRATRDISPNLRIGGSWYSSLSKLTVDSTVSGQSDGSVDNNNSRGIVGLDQRVDSYSLGPCILLQTNYEIGERKYVFLDAKLGLLFSHGKLEARQVASRGPGEFSNGVPGVREADDNSEDVAGIGSLECGLILEVSEHSAITLSGGAEYRNDSYEIINPRSSPGTVADDSDSFGGTSSYIEQVDQINLFGGVEYTHQF